ncbi:MAG: B12-binding domain-containing radical SAM protein, partial [Treponema sp.]|nr:B12-binding domain-containing radical SAM protein [Treponema sp.]
MPDILLITINAKWIHPSLALRLLKANLGSLEERAEIMEFALRQPLAEKTVPILRARPRVLAFSVSIWNHLATLELLAALNESWKRESAGKPVIVLGGPEVSWLDESAEILRHADWVIRGEGELAFRELCGLLLENETPLGPEEQKEQKQCQTELVLRLGTKGGIRAAKGKFIEAGKAGPEAVKSAYRLYTKEDLERKLVYVESSRGCPFGCEFCLSSLDRQVRAFPLEPFLAEMGDLIEKGARRFKFLDRTFNINPERAARILEFFLNKMKMPVAPEAGGPVCVHFEMVPSHLPKELRGLLARFKPGTLRLE